MKKVRLLIILFLFQSFIAVYGQETDIPKVDPAKSWGLGISINSFYDESISLDFIYQKNKHQFELALLNEAYANWTFLWGEFTYCYYPNPWKKKLDLRIESSISPYIRNNIYSKESGINISVGYGLRWRMLKHFYLTHSLQLGQTCFYTNQENYRYGSGLYTYGLIRADLGLFLNLNSFKWKRK